MTFLADAPDGLYDNVGGATWFFIFVALAGCRFIYYGAIVGRGWLIHPEIEVKNWQIVALGVFLLLPLAAWIYFLTRQGVLAK